MRACRPAAPRCALLQTEGQLQRDSLDTIDLRKRCAFTSAMVERLGIKARQGALRPSLGAGCRGGRAAGACLPAPRLLAEQAARCWVLAALAALLCGPPPHCQLPQALARRTHAPPSLQVEAREPAAEALFTAEEDGAGAAAPAGADEGEEAAS